REVAASLVSRPVAQPPAAGRCRRSRRGSLRGRWLARVAHFAGFNPPKQCHSPQVYSTRRPGAGGQGCGAVPLLLPIPASGPSSAMPKFSLDHAPARPRLMALAAATLLLGACAGRPPAEPVPAEVEPAPVASAPYDTAVLADLL